MPHSEALWYVAPGRAELRPAETSAPGPGDITVRALASGISRGTERLILAGRVPRSEFQRMRCPMQEGDFPFPVKYGYALVGTVVDGAASLMGRTVFALHPHQSMVTVPQIFVHAVPDGIPPARACLAANMETALNVTWDAGLTAGQKILIVGGGVLGLLTAALAVAIPGTKVTVADTLASRADVVRQMGAAFVLPDAAPLDQDVVIHTSASESGLVRALECAGFEAKVVEASWFGERMIALPLGAAFHSQRLQLISSQVGAVTPSHRGEWTHGRRLARALELLQDEKFDALVTAEIPFAEAPMRLPAALSDDSSGLMTVLRY